MLSPELRHRHSGLGWDGEKVRYADLEGKPEIIKYAHRHTWAAGEWERIDYNDLLNKPTSIGWQYASGNASKPGTTGNSSITGLWFQPKMVRITAFFSSSGSTSKSDGVFTATHQYCRYDFFSGWVNVVWGTVATVYITNGGNYTTAVKTSLDADWFTMNWTDVSVACSFIWEAFG